MFLYGVICRGGGIGITRRFLHPTQSHVPSMSASLFPSGERRNYEKSWHFNKKEEKGEKRTSIRVL
jgi:hypothetical protein